VNHARSACSSSQRRSAAEPDIETRTGVPAADQEPCFEGTSTPIDILFVNLAAGERLGGMLPHRLHQDAGAMRDHHDRQPEGKETALGTIGPPAESQPHGVEEDDRPEEHQEGCGGDVGGAHPVT